MCEEVEALAAACTGLRVHDLRHSAASIWLGAGVDAKVVQRVLGHATASMTLDLYGHVIDGNLRRGADLIGGQVGAVDLDKSPQRESVGLLETTFSGGSGVEPPVGVEPTTYALRELFAPRWQSLTSADAVVA